MPTIREIAGRVKNGEEIFLFDLRRPREYSDYHIEGSINIPFEEIDDINYMVSDMNAEIYFICGTGRYSRNAERILKYLGYKRVYDLGALK